METTEKNILAEYLIVRINQCLVEMDWSEKHLAEQANLAPSTLNSNKNRKGIPTMQTVIALCGSLSISIDQLLGEELSNAIKNNEIYEFLIKWNETK